MPVIDDSGRRITGASASNAPAGNWQRVLFGGRSVPSVRNGFWNPGRYSNGHHTGVDFGMPSGTKVYVPSKGTVVFAGWSGAYGNRVVVRMPDGRYMTFSHLSSIGVHSGQKLSYGSYLGKVGSTGNSSGPHLHLEILASGTGGRYQGNRGAWLNPISYLNGSKQSGSPHGGSDGGSGGSSGGGSSSGGGGGLGNSLGGSGVSGGFTKKEFYQYLSGQFGDLDTLFKLDKEAHLKGGSMTLRGAIDYIVKKKITDPSIMATILKKTAWFKTYGQDITTRLVEERQQPGLAKKNIEAQKATIVASLNSSGLRLSNARVQQIARDAWVYGWNADQVEQKIAAAAAGTEGGPSIDGGEIGAKMYDVDAYADDFGQHLSDAQRTQLAQDMLEGRGDERIREQIRKAAVASNPMFADRLEAGESLRSLTDAYFNAASELLEVDANALNWQDSLFKNGKAWTTTDQKTGQVRTKTLAEFERDIKSDKRWLNTKNGREELTRGAHDILGRFGLVAG